MKPQLKTITSVACTCVVLIIAGSSSVSNGQTSESPQTLATELVGPTYPIKEVDAIEAIQNKLAAMEKSGALERLKDEAKARIEKQILSPLPVSGISIVEKSNIRYFDPTYILNEDIFDHDGNIIAAKGTRVNPLEVMPVHKKLFFFDGRSNEQVLMAEKFAKEYGTEFTPILTAGDWAETSNRLKQAVYFDQQGKMTTRLTVTSVPSLVFQEGTKMRIEEIKP